MLYNGFKKQRIENMYELVKLTDKCFYIDCPAKICIYKPSESDVYLIDSGSDKDTGKKVKKIIDSNGWQLKAIFNTHSHADHIGGNKYLQSQTGCKVYAKGIECDFTNHTILEPSLLYSGMPYNELCHKFLLAQESDALPLTQDVLPQGLTLIELGGHTFDMVGFKSDDGVLFIADCLSSKATIDKYGIGYIYNIEEYLKTLENVKQMVADVFVPSHAEVTHDIAPLAQYNIDKVNEICNVIVAICKEPICFDQLLQKLFNHYSLKMTHQQYVLVGSTVRSYLSWLKKQGKIDAVFENNIMLWKETE